MTIQPVVKMGNPKLLEPSLPVERPSAPEIRTLIQDMLDTMKEKQGVGLAAPQIGHNVRIIAVGFEKNERYPHREPIPLRIVINPMVEILSDERVDDWEGCLSIPGLRGLVPRYRKIKYTGYDPEGSPVSYTAEDFHARIVQHEHDHLEGILFPQRLKDMKFFGFEDEIQKTLKVS